MPLFTMLTFTLVNGQSAGVAPVSRSFHYSFSRAQTGLTTLDEYLDQRMRGSNVLHYTAEWERPAPPALTPTNFYNYVPRCKTPSTQLHGLTEISRALGYRLVEFSLRCLESAVAAWVARLGIEPTPEEIVAAVPDYAGLQENSDDPAWMVSRAFSNWVVKAAVINALHSRWGHPHNPRAAPRTIPDALQAPPDSRHYCYSFAAPGSTQTLGLYAYLRQRAQDYPALLGQAKWELDLDDLPRQFGYNDFWYLVGRPAKANIRHASLALCYRLVWLALKYLEDCAADLEKRRQVEPTPEEIMAQFYTTAKRWRPERHGDDMEMYARITAHPVLAAAITNALYFRWGRPHNPRAVALKSVVPMSARLLMKTIGSCS